MSSIVVVGAGLGGSLAALSAARMAPEIEVGLVSTAPWRYRYEPGTVDVLGYREPDSGPVERPLAAMRSLPETHPYRRLGRDRVREALGFFDDLFAGDSSLPYRGGTDRNALVPTAQGTVRPTSRYPAGLAGGLVSRQRPMYVVGLEEITHLDAELVATRLDDALPYGVDSTTVGFPVSAPEHPPFEAFARALDEDTETEEGVPCREALAERVRPALDIEPRVGFPAVLGLDAHEEVRRSLESLLQADVFEIPVGEPQLPGHRLGKRLRELVRRADIDRTAGSVAGFEAHDGTVQSVTVDPRTESGQLTLEADVFVLATGGLATGGLAGTDDGVVEPIFDCPTTDPGGPVERSDVHPLGDHSFARAGVKVTADLRPAAGGEPSYDNLLAAGTVLGGFNFVRERSRGGVAVATGHAAGQLAVERIRG